MNTWSSEKSTNAGPPGAPCAAANAASSDGWMEICATGTSAAGKSFSNGTQAP